MCVMLAPKLFLHHSQHMAAEVIDMAGSRHHVRYVSNRLLLSRITHWHTGNYLVSFLFINYYLLNNFLNFESPIIGAASVKHVTCFLLRYSSAINVATAAPIEWPTKTMRSVSKEAMSWSTLGRRNRKRLIKPSWTPICGPKCVLSTGFICAFVSMSAHKPQELTLM